MDPSMRMKIGFLGLGTMGFPMAHNLARAGHAVTGWNRTAAKAEPLVAKGARPAETPRHCATGQDLVFTCLADERAVEEVLEGDQGVLAGLSAGEILVDVSTSGVRATRWMEERVTARGAALVAAPVLGSKAAAERAQLVVVAGGPPAALDRARPALHAISARLVELDDPARAALMKLVVNAIGGAMIAGFGEALALGAAGGLDLAKIIETVQASSFHSPIYLMKGEQVLARDWKPRFSIALAEKDQRLAQEAAAELGARMPVNGAVRRLFADAVESGRGDRDLAAVADLCFERAGLPRSQGS
jgi:3-hydroxyisobutyrate dehydrogenase-like beta-hydroxyacid dehydrogenase